MKASGPWPISGYYFRIHWEGLRKAAENLSQDSQCLDWDSNQVPPKYKSQALPLEPTCFLVGWLMNWKGFWRAIMAQLRYYLGICLEGVRKITVNRSQDSWCPGRDLNWVRPKYKFSAIPLHQPAQWLWNYFNYDVAYLLKAKTVEPEKQPLLVKSSKTFISRQWPWYKQWNSVCC
jgi:hypothetical protein